MIGIPIDIRYRYTYIGAMLTKDVIEHFGSQAKVAEALGIKQSSVAEWGRRPPALRQIQIEQLVGGKLKAHRSCFDPKQARAA